MRRTRRTTRTLALATVAIVMIALWFLWRRLDIPNVGREHESARASPQKVEPFVRGGSVRRRLTTERSESAPETDSRRPVATPNLLIVKNRFGAPIPDVRLRAVISPLDESEGRTLELRTAIDGTARFSTDVPSRVVVYCDRGKTAVLKTTGSHGAITELKIDDGVRVRGQVVGENGEGIACVLRHAAKWHVSLSNECATSSDGTFSLDGLREGTSFVACNGRSQSSETVVVGNYPMEQVKLRLCRAGCSIVVVVMPGDVVSEIGECDAAITGPLSESTPEGELVWMSCSGDVGRGFTADCLRPGRYRVRVKARNASVVTRDADVSEVAPNCTMQVSLEPLIEVRGKVLDPSGAPIAGALVQASGMSTDALDQAGRATTGADGQFSLDVDRSAKTLSGSKDGWTKATTEIGSETPTIILHRQLSTMVRVLDDRGEALGGWGVVARMADAPRSPTLGEGVTDAKGELLLHSDAASSTDVVVWSPILGRGFGGVGRSQATTDAPVECVIQTSRFGSMICEFSGAAPETCRVTRRGAVRGTLDVAVSNGRCMTPPMPPGDYFLSAGGRNAWVRLRDFTIGDATGANLGLLSVEPCGFLDLRLEGDDSARWSAEVVLLNGAARVSTLHRTLERPLPLAAGEWMVSVGGAGVVPSGPRKLVIRAGLTTETVISLHSGSLSTITVVFADPKERATTYLAVSRTDGTNKQNISILPHAREPNRSWHGILTDGAITIAAQSVVGHEVRLDVDRTGKSGDLIEIRFNRIGKVDQVTRHLEMDATGANLPDGSPIAYHLRRGTEIVAGGTAWTEHGVAVGQAALEPGRYSLFYDCGKSRAGSCQIEIRGDEPSITVEIR